MFRIVPILLLLFAVGACASPIVVTNRDTGASGSGEATGAMFGSMGKMSLAIEGEVYSGTWVAMRDAGRMNLTFWSLGPKDSGVGIANLTSASGKYLRCEFGYSLSSGSGIGLCKSKDGVTYDFMVSI